MTIETINCPPSTDLAFILAGRMPPSRALVAVATSMSANDVSMAGEDDIVTELTLCSEYPNFHCKVLGHQRQDKDGFWSFSLADGSFIDIPVEDDRQFQQSAIWDKIVGTEYCNIYASECVSCRENSGCKYQRRI